MDVADLDYRLPEASIAQEPLPQREDARLLVVDRAGGTTTHDHVRGLAAHLRRGDLLVLNDTRVLPARLRLRRDTGGAVECLLLEESADGTWEALVRAGGSLAEGETLSAADGERVALLGRLGGGHWRVGGDGTDLRTLMERHGVMPLPPYIRRGPEDPRSARDRERYQTLFARREGAVAAPTAGLHVTPSLLDDLGSRGVGHAFVTLHVGLGTFAPVRAARLEDHVMHEEGFAIPVGTEAAIRRTRSEGGRVVAVGTTVVRTLEASAAAAPDGWPRSESGRTRLLIQPGHRFRAVDALLTNFHLPRSTLIALVAAFAGRERVLGAYEEAVREGYRFYSYGDAMLLL